MGEKEILEELLEKYADPNKVRYICHYFIKMVPFLWNLRTCCGVPMFIQGKGPPLLVASDLGYEDIADLLMEHGADPDKEDEVCAVEE